MLQTKTDYVVQQESWFSPTEIIDRFEQLRKPYGKTLEQDPLFKKAREMFGAAISLLGAYELSEQNTYYMQINKQTDSPDVMAAKLQQLQDGSNQSQLLQLEVVDYEDHYPSDDIVEFLQNTKLSGKKAYNEFMNIICFVNRVVPLRHQEIHDRIQKIAPKCTLYILGRPIDSPMGTYSMFSPYPLHVKPIMFNVDTTAAKYELKPRISLSMGMGNALVYTENELEALNTYDILGLDQKKIEAKYGK